MSSELVKALAAKQPEPLSLVPCVVVTISPLTVSLNGATIPGVKIAGAIYTTGPANALWAPPAAPVVLPIGV